MVFDEDNYDEDEEVNLDEVNLDEVEYRFQYVGEDPDDEILDIDTKVDIDPNLFEQLRKYFGLSTMSYVLKGGKRRRRTRKHKTHKKHRKTKRRRHTKRRH